MKKIVCVIMSVALLLGGCGNIDAENNIDTENSSKSIVESEVSTSDEAENTKAIVPAESTAEEDESKQTVSICMVGDILLHTPIEELSKDSDGTYDYHTIFEDTKDIIEAKDIAIVNQEVIIGGEELGISGYPAFNAPYEIGDELVDTGFDVICHATNHALDKGKSGITNCLEYWEREHNNTTVVGLHNSQEDQDTIRYVEVNGIRIAILNYTYGTNGISLPSDMPYAVDMLDEDRVCSDLDEAEKSADFTIVCPHWGIEYRLTPTDDQKKWASLMVSHGADLIIGTHPHVIEPIEWIGDENSEKGLCYYSLGNYVNWTSGTGEGVANRMVGGLANVTIMKESDGSVDIVEYGITPLICHVTNESHGIRVLPITEYSEELAGENAIINQDSEFSYEYCKQLCEEVWGADYTE